MPEKHPIHAKYPELHKSPVVEKSATQHRRHGESVPNEPGPKLEAWLSDLERIHTGRGASAERQAAQPQVLERIKRIYHRDYITGTDDASVERYLRHQAQIDQDRGGGMVEEIMERVNDQVIEQTRETIQEDQERSLDAWIDYLTSDDATYPMWFKYYVFRNITKLADYDKQKGEFPKRSKSTTARFPDINPEALAYMQDSLAKHYGLKPLDPNNPEDQIDPTMKQLLDKDANFASLYKRAIDYAAPKTIENLDVTDGVWVKYDQTNDPEEGKRLAHSLHGYGTGWCTAGEGTAQSQLAEGDFYVYYTKSEDGQYSVPRVAIRMQGSSIGEVRGIEANQNLEGALVPIAEAKMNEVDPQGAEAYKKKAEDMRQLTDIYARHSAGKELSKHDISFLYELDSEIDGFGYGKDPRIERIQRTRNFADDMSTLFDTKDHNLIIQKIIETGRGRVVPRNLDKFQGLDHNAIAQQLIGAGEGKSVVENLDKFQGLNYSNEFAQQLIGAGQGQAVAENLDKFEGLDHNSIAQQLFVAGDGWAVAENIDKFQGIDHKAIALQLVEAGDGWAIANNLDKFEGLSPELIKEIDMYHRSRF